MYGIWFDFVQKVNFGKSFLNLNSNSVFSLPHQSTIWPASWVKFIEIRLIVCESQVVVNLWKLIRFCLYTQKEILPSVISGSSRGELQELVTFNAELPTVVPLPKNMGNKMEMVERDLECCTGF